jgi:hypothetical protein
MRARTRNDEAGEHKAGTVSRAAEKCYLLFKASAVRTINYFVRSKVPTAVTIMNTGHDAMLFSYSQPTFVSVEHIQLHLRGRSAKPSKIAA